ncbi:uncharacterized protein [Haliotis asinina]|uniref:uncharacterized protein n=1 Tax=Haliotis asinina TaxID=109174 RepID=UPI003531B952
MSSSGQRPTLRTAVLQFVCPSRLLGTGCFGNVYKAGHNKSQYAVKVSPLSNLSDTNAQCILKEAVTLSQFAHMHVVKYLDCWEERDRQEAWQLYLVMEYCQGRDLRHFLENTLQHPPEEEVFGCWLAQIASGLEHIHSHNVIHRNLKTSNILVWCYSEQVVLKIGGFGLSKGLKHFNDVARSIVGTANFMSPELVVGKEYDRKTDIWSFGCTAFEIATLRSPKPNLASYLETYVKYSSFFKDLIRRMLMIDADCRPGANMILKLLVERGYRPHDGITPTSSVSTVSSEPPSSLHQNCDMTPVLESRGRHCINSCANTTTKRSGQGIDVALNTLKHVRRAERDKKVKSRDRNGTNSCEGTTSAELSNQGIDVALNTLTHVRRAERDKKVKSRDRNGTNSCEGTTSAELSNQGVDVALNTLTHVRRAERDKKVKSRDRNGTNSCEGTTSAELSNQGVDVALNTLTHVRRAERDKKVKSRDRNGTSSCEGTTSAELSNQGIDVALNTLTHVRRAERDKKVKSRDRNGTSSCEGTTSAKPSSHDVAVKTDILSRRAKHEQQMKKTVTFAPSTSLSYCSSGSGYETDIGSFGMSGSFTSSPGGLFNTSEHGRHSNTEMSRGTSRNPETEIPESPTPYETGGCSTNRSIETGRCADISSNADIISNHGDRLNNTASCGSGYEPDNDADRDMWINDQIATLQPDVARSIGREVFVALYPTLNIQDEALFTLHLMDQLEDEDVCEKIKRLWRLEKEKRERDGERRSS